MQVVTWPSPKAGQVLKLKGFFYFSWGRDSDWLDFFTWPFRDSWEGLHEVLPIVIAEESVTYAEICDNATDSFFWKSSARGKTGPAPLPRACLFLTRSSFSRALLFKPSGEPVAQGAGAMLFRLLCYVNAIYWLTWRTNECMKDTAEQDMTSQAHEDMK